MVGEGVSVQLICKNLHNLSSEWVVEFGSLSPAAGFLSSGRCWSKRSTTPTRITPSTNQVRSEQPAAPFSLSDMNTCFPQIKSPIPFEGPKNSSPLAFKWYEANRMV